MLRIKNLSASIENKPILNGVSLKILPGEIHILMGPNGSGKSTLAHLLMGKPGLAATGGTVTLNSKNLLALSPSERAARGLFLGFQYPLEIPGVTISHFLRLAKKSLRAPVSPLSPELHSLSPEPSRGATVKTPKEIYPSTSSRDKFLSITDFRKQLDAAATSLNIPKDLLSRDLNVGFSGGEKKRLEMLQMLVLEPKFAILDETDSGLDIDALRLISKTIQRAAKEQNVGVLLITHYTRILKELTPNAIHVFMNGRIVKSGGDELAHELEREGYAKYEH